MDEQDLRERLLAAAATDQPPASAAADLARGRRGRRRHTMVIGGTALGTAAVLGTFGVAAGVAMHGTTATQKAPRTVTENGWAAHSSKHTAKATPRANKGNLSNGGYDAWTNQVFGLAGQDLDPQHEFTSYSMNIQENQTGPHYALGTRITWQRSGESGEGMVDVLLASPGSPRYAGACTEFGPCRDADSPGFGHYLISGDPADGKGFEVIVTQADGEIADVLVDPLYGNNALTPTEAPLPTLDQVLTLAEDPALNLPSS